ncbi:DUF917 domain-containing protein [Amycolatopsis taiwanensis]|uniref:DUF917 domain-containing protein n=1 Tax=Amycolatopsis taiwanensis TaxID=342230 RepID=A0A9W6R4H0_9PSEU|nr:DUF917 domain-containing protein [Amycolatopsis taiwanensis]GLY69093.1 hypothetical protein Atai01_57120 [Amycolatopsis taiwanensis]
MEHVAEAEVDDVVRGALHFGSGGGGDPYLGQQLLAAAVRRHGPIPLMTPQALDPDALVLPVVSAGAPYALIEKAHSTLEAETLRSAVETRTGRTFAAILPIQLGAVNVAVPLVVAAELGLPCLDSDLMRRTLPSIDMTLLRLSGHPVPPITVVGGAGVVAEFSRGEDTVLGELVRAVMPRLGLVALVSAYRVTARDCAGLGAARSISECARIGAALAAVSPSLPGGYEPYLRACGGRLLCTGTVAEVVQHSTDGWPRGVVSLQTSGGFVRIDFQNENLIVSREGTVLATVPDLIGLADANTGALMQSTDLALGQDVHVITAPVDPRWHTPEGHAMVGPRAFGYAVDPVPFDGVAAVASA